MADSLTSPSLRWDIFCRVVDNFGDAGICWRLARQLVREQGQQVTLFIDDLAVLGRLLSELDTNVERQSLDGIVIQHWTESGIETSGTDVVIEAFGCTLPANYLSQLTSITRRALWLNLEYLSAESWVEGCHLLPSPVEETSGSNLKKFFFFPGFTDKTGGLLREQDLLSRRDRFQQSDKNRSALLKQFGINIRPNDFLISLFSYENPALGSWLEELSQHSTRVHLLVLEGPVVKDIAYWLGEPTPRAGDHFQRGQCHLHILPFVRPDDYDQLLWCCDLNIVRGEDSFVRAQWAGMPKLWHIYPQDDGVHLEKLDAFLTLYNQAFSPEADSAARAFWQTWNRGKNLPLAWRNLLAHWPAIQAGSRAWCDALSRQKKLSEQLVTFAKKQLIFAPRNIS
ncbi:putative repeat protein (TIGR03837 family) [Litorivivens lipolytica]|uniref:Protein-arginine rhamnosyltransferase n=1 Tax=Litorivivens lipolytica TaxID=1524264 RepID=A0A7W4Z673_9GAMM|nr:putative repeat protein (TIGR03837 family) [Litorivivens lipolytica]